MRDFRDAKAMARTLRVALAAKGLKITISESLELIAKAFGVADWNTLSAAVRAAAPARRNDASPSPPPTAERVLGPRPHFSRELELTLRRALADANHREHDHATLEHLLLALIEDMDASAVMKASNVDLGALKKNVANYVDNELRGLEHGERVVPIFIDRDAPIPSVPLDHAQRVVMLPRLRCHSISAPPEMS